MTNPSSKVPEKSAPTAITSSPRFSKIWATLAFNALNTTNASGSTIFLREGSQFCCVARFGKAPTVGTLMRPRGGLFADCIEARQLVVCNENASSKLADLPYKQRPNCTSAALVPFELEGRVEGVIAVFSTFPSAFRQSAWDKLSAIAMVVESVLFSVSFARNAPKPGSSASSGTTETYAPNASFTGPVSPPASYDSDQDFLRHMSSMLPPPRDAAAEAEVDPIDAILAKVCGDLDLISGRASRGQTRVSLESALPDSGAPLAAFNFDDELRAAEMQGLEAPETFLPASRASARNDRVTKPTRPDPAPAIGFDVSGLAIPEIAESAAPAVDDAQAAVEELMRQAGSHVDHDVASNYLSQLEDLFAQPPAAGATPELKLEPAPAAVPQAQLPELLFMPPREAVPQLPLPRPVVRLQPVELPPIELPPIADEDINFESRYSLSPWAITLIVALVALIVAGALLWSR